MNDVHDKNNVFILSNIAQKINFPPKILFLSMNRATKKKHFLEVFTNCIYKEHTDCKKFLSQSKI